MKWITTIALAFLLTGCSIIPKSVEFGQKKVKSFPAHPAAQLESERQAVALAAVRAREAEKIAEADSSLAARPAGEAAELSEAVGRSLGPPANAWNSDVSALSAKLDGLTAKYNKLLDKFADRNDEFAGKKIEGTGFLQIPYFVYIGVIFVVGWIIWMLLKTFANVAGAANPGVAVGLKVAQVGGRALSRGFSQLVAGGQSFKDKIAKEVTDPALRDKILETFRVSHQTHQDNDVQSLIQKLKE